MLVTLKELLKTAEIRQCAIGSFNTPNLESLLAVLQAAEKLGASVEAEILNACRIFKIWQAARGSAEIS